MVLSSALTFFDGFKPLIAALRIFAEKICATPRSSPKARCSGKLRIWTRRVRIPSSLSGWGRPMSRNWLVIVAGWCLVTRSTLAPAVVLASLVPHLFFVRRVWNSAADTAMRPRLVGRRSRWCWASRRKPPRLGNRWPVAARSRVISPISPSWRRWRRLVSSSMPGRPARGMGMVDRDARRGVPDSVVGRSGSRMRGQRPGAAAVAKSLEPFFGLLVFAGVTNYLPTRYGLAALCLGLGLTSFALALSGGVSVERRALLWTAFPARCRSRRQCANGTPRACGGGRTL